MASKSYNNMSELTAAELDDIYAFAVELGKEAGKMLMDAAKVRMGDTGSREQREHVQKENAVDLVTETDESKMIRYTHVQRECRPRVGTA